MCLLSPQSVAQVTQNSSDGFHAKSNHGIFTFAGFTKTIFYQSQNNLLIFFTSSDLTSITPNSSSLPYNSHTSLLSTTESHTTTPLSSIQQKLLLKHQQMGHLHMAKVQKLAHDGIFGAHAKNLSDCDVPLCKACLHGKMHKLPLVSASFHHIDALHLEPGDCVSGDQLESTHPGIIAT